MHFSNTKEQTYCKNPLLYLLLSIIQYIYIFTRFDNSQFNYGNFSKQTRAMSVVFITRQGRSALFHACSEGNLSVAKAIVGMGGDMAADGAHIRRNAGVCTVGGGGQKEMRVSIWICWSL